MAKHTPNPHSKQDMNPAQDMTFERDMTPATQESASARMPPRRGFLKSALVGATAIAGVALTASASAETTRIAESASGGGEAKGYRESDHIRRYYRLAREI